MEYLLFQEDDILERVDEYALYCHYLGYQPLIGGKYPSPVRSGIHFNEDRDPSFGIYERKYGKGAHEFLWKDIAANIHGDIFDLVNLLFDNINSRAEAMRMVMADFGIGGHKIDKVPLPVPERQYLEPIEIQVKSKPFTKMDLAFWQQFNINQQLLEEYTVLSIAAYWMTRAQTKPDFPRGLGFAYREWNLYQLYFPHADKKYKFRHNYTEVCVHGFKQLRYNSDLCVITKSRKDVMCLRSFGYEAISPRSENTMVPELCLKLLERKYKNILVLFDNDGKHAGGNYPYDKRFVPTTLQADDKDPSDYCKHHGPQATKEMLAQILQV